MIRSIIQIPVRLTRTRLSHQVSMLSATRYALPTVPLAQANVYWFAKISKKEKDKQKSDE